MTQEREVLRMALEALENIVNSLATHDDEGMIEHAQPMIDAREAIAAIKEARARATSRMYWQSIESAPHGVNVLIYIDKEIQLAYGRTSESGDFCGWYISDGGGSCYLDGEPTHWMHLPCPPTN